VYQLKPLSKRTISVTSDLDIWRAANPLIGQHGAEAEIVAAQRADLMLAPKAQTGCKAAKLERSDRDGQLVWVRIRRAIGELKAAPAGRRIERPWATTCSE
jgi:hypothetical protein